MEGRRGREGGREGEREWKEGPARWREERKVRREQWCREREEGGGAYSSPGPNEAAAGCHMEHRS